MDQSSLAEQPSDGKLGVRDASPGNSLDKYNARMAVDLVNMPVGEICERLEISVPEEADSSSNFDGMASAGHCTPSTDDAVDHPHHWDWDSFVIHGDLQGLGSIHDQSLTEPSAALSDTLTSVPELAVNGNATTAQPAGRELLGIPAYNAVATPATTSPAQQTNQPSPSSIHSDSNSTSSSWVIPTPLSSMSPSEFRHSPTVSSSYVGTPVESTAVPQPEPDRLSPLFRRPGCSKDWSVPPRTRKRKARREDSEPVQSDNGTGSENHAGSPRRRGRIKDEEQRKTTALTRKIHGCIRCRMLRDGCEPNPLDLTGSCLNCLRLPTSRRPPLCKLPCLRWIITDSSLYREQDRPCQMFTRRWQTMNLVDVSTWASPEVKTITISQIFLDAPYEVQVREFEPVDGDALDETWTSGGVLKKHPLPRYALADMTKTADMLEAFINANVGEYINGAVGDSDELIWETYRFAFHFVGKAATEEERNLLGNCFQLWVACRKTSNPHHIYGDDRLGAEIVDDPTSVKHGILPIPKVMVAQMECIMYTRVLRPMTKEVLRVLNKLVLQNKRKNWLTIYLTVFMLLHSCSMIARRDSEYARQRSLPAKFANPEAIMRHQSGVEVLLAHFHYLNKGLMPFHMTYDAAGLKELGKAAELLPDQVEFVRLTSQLIQEPARAARMDNIRRNGSASHDLYWVSQLYEQDWKPRLTS